MVGLAGYAVEHVVARWLDSQNSHWPPASLSRSAPQSLSALRQAVINALNSSAVVLVFWGTGVVLVRGMSR